MKSNELSAKIKAHAAALRHGTPGRRMQVIGVVGRDGAAATIAYLAEIFKTSGERVGVIAQGYLEVAGERVAGSDQAHPLDDPFRLHALLAQMKNAKCSYVLLDLAGQLPTHNFTGVRFAALVVRRIGDDRLDQVSNAAFVAQVKKLLPRVGPGLVVLPRDEAGYDSLRAEVASSETVLSFGTHQGADSRIAKVHLHPKGCAVRLVIDHQTELDLTSRHTGKSAIYNLTAAASAAYMLHVPLEVIEEGVAKLPVLAAVCEYIPVDRPYKIVLDSAVTPQGIGEVLESLKHFVKNRLIVVVSANLVQPPAWRSVVGETVAGIADRVIVTDGDYEAAESPEAVRAQLLEGVSRANAEATTEEVAERREAIEKALALARRGDTIVLCAVTTRPYRQTGTDRLEWSDRAIINELV